MFTWINQSDAGYRPQERGGMDGGDAYRTGIASALRSHGDQVPWSRTRHWCERDFIQDVDRKIAESSEIWVDLLLTDRDDHAENIDRKEKCQF